MRPRPSLRSVHAEKPSPTGTYPQSGGLFSEIRVTHGPAALLYRFFRAAEEAVHDRGVALEFGTFEQLMETNERHIGSWRSMVPLLDPRHAPLGESCFCILGRNEKGDI